MIRCWFCLISLAAVFACVTAAQPADKETPKDFEPLFNGKDLTGWKVNKAGKMKFWGAENGMLFVKGGGGGWLMTEKEYANFEPRLEYKLPSGGNSGVALRSPLEGDPSSAGMEIQILDDAWHKDEKNYKGLQPTQLTGSIYGVVPPALDATKRIGEWNQMHITARGRQITVVLNGKTIVDANLDTHKNHVQKHPGLLREKGHLGLQSHDGRVEFRNLYVKPL
jgi:Domain of Unknown Function (DUF1080)